MMDMDELRGLLEDIGFWGRLRADQGLDLEVLDKRLRKELKRARKELRKMTPGDKQLRAEPNDLDAIRALRPEGPRRLWKSLKTRGLTDRIKGAWLGRAAGCILGAPVENWSIEAMANLAAQGGMEFPPEDYWTTHPEPRAIRYELSAIADYLKGGMKAVPVDDDLTYTILGLLILETFGPAFTTNHVAVAWLKYLPVACTAEAVALDNLRKCVPAAKAGEKNNPYQEWIGADIRSDPWGYAAPGWPEKAAELAYRDAYLSHRQNGVYGAMFFAAAIAAAFAVDSPAEALEIGLTEIPAKCRLAEALRWALDEAPRIGGWREARAAVDERFPGMHSVHTINNACLTVFGLILGQGNLTDTIGMTVAMALDNDCTAATAGSIVGAIQGAKQLPPHWWRPFRNRTRTYLTGEEWFRNDDIARRFVAAARKVWAADSPTSR